MKNTIKNKLRQTQSCEHSNIAYMNDLFPSHLKKKGQVFTPAAIADFMAHQFENSGNKKIVRLLDPGSGSGILTVAACEALLAKKNVHAIEATLYENDPQVLPLLRKNLKTLKHTLAVARIQLKYRVIDKDFVTENSRVLSTPTKKFDFIVSNPPYYKLNKAEKLSNAMKTIVSGQPNIYWFFMALAANLLADDGQMTFITPRSFCSGEYSKVFRKWFLGRTNIQKIHLFESRKEPFNNQVLQETVILTSGTKTSKFVSVSSSRNASFADYKCLDVSHEKVLHRVGNDILIRIPTTKSDLRCLDVLDNYIHKLKDHDLKVSTGPIVDFRLRPWLDNSHKQSANLIPLLWMHNIKNFGIVWPNGNKAKPPTIRRSSETNAVLRKNCNYVFLKRFTSKEQPRRLYASAYRKNTISSQFVGIENHLNYIWSPKGELEYKTVLGLTALLNSSIYDQYFRILNGNTQVNASDINLLPIPSFRTVNRIGEDLQKAMPLSYEIIDEKMREVLNEELPSN